MNTIGRRAVDVKKTVGSLAYGQRTIQGKGIAGTATVALRRDDRDNAKGGERFGQYGQTGREVAVIVTQKDMHASPAELCKLGWRCDRAGRRD